MDTKGWLWKGALAIAGSVLGAYIGQELIGGGAIGGTVTGAIVGVSIYPLFSTLFRYRKEKAAKRMR